MTKRVAVFFFMECLFVLCGLIAFQNGTTSCFIFSSILQDVASRLKKKSILTKQSETSPDFTDRFFIDALERNNYLVVSCISFTRLKMNFFSS